MSDTYLIGVDLGTMGTKAAIFNAEGNLIAEAYEESKLYYPNNALMRAVSMLEELRVLHSMVKWLALAALIRIGGHRRYMIRGWILAAVLIFPHSNNITKK